MPAPGFPPSEHVTFANDIARELGLDPRVVYAWTQEETGGTPYGGFHNWLNLRPYPGDPYFAVSPGGFEEFRNMQDAETATLRRLRQPFAAGIRASAHKSPSEEIAAIAASDWDAGHYGGAGGPSLRSVFASLFGSGQLGTYSGSATNPTGGSAPQPGGVPNPANLVTGPLGEAKSFLEKWIIRGFLMVLGSGLILLGLYLIVRSLGAPSIGVMDKATRVVTRGAVAPGASSRQSQDAAVGRAVRREDARTARKQARERAATDRAREKRLAEYGDVPF